MPINHMLATCCPTFWQGRRKNLNLGKLGAQWRIEIQNSSQIFAVAYVGISAQTFFSDAAASYTKKFHGYLQLFY